MVLELHLWRKPLSLTPPATPTIVAFRLRASARASSLTHYVDSRHGPTTPSRIEETPRRRGRTARNQRTCCSTNTTARSTSRGRNAWCFPARPRTWWASCNSRIAIRRPSSGAAPAQGFPAERSRGMAAIITVFSRMNRILEVDVENQRATSAARRREFGLERRRGSYRTSFCARSFEPEGVHDRRQRLGEFGRPAHAGLRRDHESRARARNRAADRRTDARSAARRWIRRATT